MSSESLLSNSKIQSAARYNQNDEVIVMYPPRRAHSYPCNATVLSHFFDEKAVKAVKGSNRRRNHTGIRYLMLVETESGLKYEDRDWET